MLVWLIKSGEPLPFDGENVRLLRMGILANTLVKQGHEVVWWAATFNHKKKSHRFDQNTTIQVNESFQIKLLHSCGYKKNISIARIRDHHHVAQQFKKLAELETRKPDVILCALPTLELAYCAAEFSQKHHIPIFLDIRDLWPDIFLDISPRILRPLLRFLLKPMYRMATFACRNVTGILGNAPYFVEWGLKLAKREPSKFDKFFPFGYSALRPSDADIEESKVFWKSHGIDASQNEFVVCFFGNLGHYADLSMVIESAKKLNQSDKKIKFVFCGNGDSLASYQKIANDYKNIIFPGWVNAPKIWTLMRMSAVGLVPYKRNTVAYMDNLPNKPIEYFSAGLPILSSIQGYLENLLNKHQCGITYSDEPSFMRAIHDLYDNPQKLKEMSANAYDLYLNNYVGETIYENMVEHIKSAVLMA